jgi:hypothetical protein
MTIEPLTVDRAEQPYAAVKKRVTMHTIPSDTDRIPDGMAHR